MDDLIPYSSMRSGKMSEIYPYLHNGVLSANDANLLLDQGIEWPLVSPSVLDRKWWQHQDPKMANPLKLDWHISIWGATINLELPELSVWIDPGPKALLPHNPPDLIVITHAHHDHTSRLSEFSSTHPDCPIVMSALTYELLRLRAILDTSLSECLNRNSVQLPINEVRRIEGVSVRLLEAGHLIGSVMVEMEFQGDRILETGDFTLRDVGGLPEPGWPNDEYNLVIMESNTAGWNSLPYFDVEANRQPFLTQVNNLLKVAQTFSISAQSFGQSQEIYAGLIMAQRAGAFPDHMVCLSGFASEVSSIYFRELMEQQGPWNIPFISIEAAVPPNSIVISATEIPGLKGLNKPRVYTHAGWCELMTLAVGLACNQVMFYHGDSLSLHNALKDLGRDIRFPNK